MPVYVAVARTQPPLSGSWGARLLTPVSLPGIENKNIHVPLSMSQSYHTPFHPTHHRCRYIFFLNRFADVQHRYRTMDIFVTTIFSSSFFALFVLKIRVLLPAWAKGLEERWRTCRICSSKGWLGYGGRHQYYQSVMCTQSKLYLHSHKCTENASSPLFGFIQLVHTQNQMLIVGSFSL